MKSQVVKRFNVNLTIKEERALELLEEEYTTRGWDGNRSDIIREAIIKYCKECTGNDLTKITI